MLNFLSYLRALIDTFQKNLNNHDIDTKEPLVPKTEHTEACADPENYVRGLVLTTVHSQT